MEQKAGEWVAGPLSRCRGEGTVSPVLAACGQCVSG